MRYVLPVPLSSGLGGRQSWGGGSGRGRVHTRNGRVRREGGRCLKDPVARISPILSPSVPTSPPPPPLHRGAATLHEPGCACQLSDRKRPRPASPESAIYLYFVPCQSFMPWSSEIRQSWFWCYAACFAQRTPRGH